jgi:acyl-coenzyme A thioesterase PaaI-like protein
MHESLGVTRQASLFETDTAVCYSGDQCFSATITDRWNGLAGRPLGGFVLATALRALQETVAYPDILVASAYFLKPVEPGPVELRTDLARHGRRSATGEARLYQAGAEALRTIATFTDLQSAIGPSVVRGSPPMLPGASEAVELHVGGDPPIASVAERIEYRIAPDGYGPVRGVEVPEVELWMRLKEGGGEDLLSIPFMVDAAPPAVLEIGATGSTTLELTVHLRARPSSEWIACRATTRYLTNGYHEEDFEVWDEQGRLVAQSRQLAKLPKGDLRQKVATT